MFMPMTGLRTVTSARPRRAGSTLAPWGALSTLLHVLAAALISSRARGPAPPDDPMTLLPIEVDAPAPASLPVTLEEPTPPVSLFRREVEPPLRRAARPPASVPRAAAALEPVVARVFDPPPGDDTEAPEVRRAPPRSPPPPPPSVPAPAPPARAAHIPPAIAKGLREYDAFPSLPAPMRLLEPEHIVVVDVCVSEQGYVDDVSITEGAAELLDGPLRAAIRTWRYRPLLVSGTPTRFCHVVRIDYRVN
jgi:hypothetical protein